MALHDTLHFVACHDCAELHPVDSPSAALFGDGDTDGTDAYAEFLSVHRAHRVACLWRSGPEVRADRPLWDPMATLIFEVSDGERSYVVSASRPSIEEERVYRFKAGALEVGNSEVQIDPRDLRRGLDLQFYPHALRATKIDRFLSAVHEAIHQIDPDHLEIAFDAADDPAVSIAGLPDGIYNQILARCSEIFDPWELPRVVDFLRDNREADGLLALRVRRHVVALSA
jgi:hypothetical protein